VRILHVGDDFAALRPCGLTLYADALMQAQAALGHDVSYVFSGRHYPKLERPRLKRWKHGRVRMIELIGSPIQAHWERGTRHPLRDLEEPSGEKAFAAALRSTQPEVVHIQELAGLPSSVIDIAKAAGLPVLMTLHDYKPICASVRLLDADGKRCLRHEVGEDCARNCASAPVGRSHLINFTLDFELARAKRAVPLAQHVDFTRAAPVVRAVKRIAQGSPPATAGEEDGPSQGSPPEHYQRRRDVNVRRLGLCDRLVAPSRRVAEIYAELGVDQTKLTVQRVTVPHLAELHPRRDAKPSTPLTFVTLGGCASPSKGSRVVVEAVQRLERAGRGDHYRLLVLGHVEPFAARELSDVPAVRLAGSYAPADLDLLLDEGDVGILPSTWEEVHGFVGIEMLAKGLPLIASALGGIPEYVEDGVTGWLDRTASGAGLARLMAAAIDDTEGVERLRRTVRERRSEIVRPMHEHVAEVDRLYGELVSNAASHEATISSPAARRASS
jgi:glycosyltransferase involved in cell wall biosynthesis